MIQLGLRLHDAEKLPLEQLLPLVKQKGYDCVHFALAKSLPQLPCTPDSLTPGYASYLKNIFAKNEMDIAVLGNYLNLAHPDESVIKYSQEKYFAHIRFAAMLGCGMVGTETGAPNTTYTFCPECRTDKALAIFIKNVTPVVRCAEQYGVTLAIEPVARHIVYNADTCRKVLDEIGSHNLQVLLDPVNMLSVDNVHQRDEIIDRSIELLGKEIVMVHLKDFEYPKEGNKLTAVGAGTGKMDFTKLMRYLKMEKPYIYATLENTTSENAAQCAQLMKKCYNEA